MSQTAVTCSFQEVGEHSSYIALRRPKKQTQPCVLTDYLLWLSHCIAEYQEGVPCNYPTMPIKFLAFSPSGLYMPEINTGMSWPSAGAKSCIGHSCHQVLSLPKVRLNRRHYKLPHEASSELWDWLQSHAETCELSKCSDAQLGCCSTSTLCGAARKQLPNTACVCGIATAKTNVIILSLILKPFILFLLFWALLLFSSQKSLSRRWPVWSQLGSEPTWISTSGEPQNHGWGMSRSRMFPQLKMLSLSFAAMYLRPNFAA